MNAAILSNNSYFQKDTRLGLQIVAEEMAQQGVEVDYFAVPSAPSDILSPSRRKSFFKAWGNFSGFAKNPVKENLTELSLRCPFSRKKKYWFTRKQIDWYASLIPRSLLEKRYDVLVCDTAVSFLFAKGLQARRKILRLNDNPEGFLHYIDQRVVDTLKEWIAADVFEQVWAVSPALIEWTKAINASAQVSLFPNGVDLKRFVQGGSEERLPKTAVYIGRFNTWFDFDLLKETAQQLSDWTFHLYGTPPENRPAGLPENVIFKGFVDYEKIPALLPLYQVGLIPFSGNPALLKAIDPLKLTQYLAAGLPVASTTLGDENVLHRKYVFYGDEPCAFAQAILDSQSVYTSSTDTDKAMRADFLNKRSWQNTVDAMLAQIQ